RRPAGLHLDAVGRRLQPHHPPAHAGRDAAAVVVDHVAGPPAPAAVRDPGPADGRPPRPPRAGGGRPQRRHDHPDDRTVLRPRRHAPLPALASARVDAMTALVSFERVSEVLDLEPLITEKPAARRVPDGPVAIEFDGVHFAYPSAERVSLASLEEVATLDTRSGVEVLHGVSFRVEPGQLVALVGSSGAGKPPLGSLGPRLCDVDAGAVRLAGVDVRA